MDGLELTPGEREAASEAGIAVFEGRLILEARPPIDDATLREVGARCAGAIPGELEALWRTCFGGRLAYDLSGSFGGHHAALSFSELFYPESDGYRDLCGWIDHELALAAEGARERGLSAPTTLEALPFGGFEYLERLYAYVAPGTDHGAVLVWQKGLPPAWTFQRNVDSVARLAPSVRALFGLLHLERDPDDDPDGRAVEMLEALDALEALGPAGRSAAEKLHRLVRRVVLDWRGAVDDGSIAKREQLARLAMEHAAATDDVVLLEKLARQGVDPRAAVRGGTPIEHALLHRSEKVTRWLLDRGAPVENALHQSSSSIDPELARELLRRGARADRIAALNAVHADRLDTALVIASALAREEARALAADALRQASEQEASASRIEKGTLSSNRTPAQLRACAVGLRTLAARALDGQALDG